MLFRPCEPSHHAWDIQEWIYAFLKIPDHDVQMIQIDGLRRQVFIKIINIEKFMTILRQADGKLEYKYPTGEVLQVTVVLAGMGTKVSELRTSHRKFPVMPCGMRWRRMGTFWKYTY
jgi:hypothetical protein